MFNILLVILMSCGWASHYNPGKFEPVIDNRQAWGQLPSNLPNVDGYAASRHPSDIGEIVYVTPEGSYSRKLLIVDCASIRNGGPNGEPSYDWMVNSGILIEWDYRTAESLNSVGHGHRI